MPIKVWAATAQVNIPAKQFVQDLRKVIEVKDRLTRRQWISLLESLLRLGAASHILWICRANSECFHVLDRVIKGDAPPTEAYLREQLSTKTPFWRYGQPAARTIKEFARDFVLARVGLNLILWHWRALNTDQEPSLASVPNIVEFARTLSAKRSEFPTQQYLEHFRAAIDDDPGVVNCKRGISSNISEFLKHVLGQRQTSEPGMDSYDQGYYLRKRGNHASAPWMFALGPVSVLTLAHCCTSASQGLPTVEDFCQHLEQYGIEARGQDVAHNDLGLILRNLGLVVDSPDAEGGMVLINPLTRTTTKVPA